MLFFPSPLTGKLIASYRTGMFLQLLAADVVSKSLVESAPADFFAAADGQAAPSPRKKRKRDRKGKGKAGEGEEEIEGDVAMEEGDLPDPAAFGRRSEGLEFVDGVGGTRGNVGLDPGEQQLGAG